MRACDIGRHDQEAKASPWTVKLGKPCPRPAVGYLAGIHVCVVHRRRLLAKGPEWCVHAELEWDWANGHGAAA